MISWKEVASPQRILHGRDAILRVRDKWLIFNMILQLWADVKYHVPTGFGFSPKASGFYPFGDAADLASEGGGGDVVWMIQASASNHKPKEPSLWFVVWGRGLNQPHHSANAALPSEGGGIAKRIKTARLRRKTNPVGTWYFESTEKVQFLKTKTKNAYDL